MEQKKNKSTLTTMPWKQLVIFYIAFFVVVRAEKKDFTSFLENCI